MTRNAFQSTLLILGALIMGIACICTGELTWAAFYYVAAGVEAYVAQKDGAR